jgi:hypothetical protein
VSRGALRSLRRPFLTILTRLTSLMVTVENSESRARQFHCGGTPRRLISPEAFFAKTEGGERRLIPPSSIHPTQTGCPLKKGSAASRLAVRMSGDFIPPRLVPSADSEAQSTCGFPAACCRENLFPLRSAGNYWDTHFARPTVWVPRGRPLCGQSPQRLPIKDSLRSLSWIPCCLQQGHLLLPTLLTLNNACHLSRAYGGGRRRSPGV